MVRILPKAFVQLVVDAKTLMAAFVDRLLVC